MKNLKSACDRDIDDLTVKDLKAWISGAGLTHDDCYEKADLSTRLDQAIYLYSNWYGAVVTLTENK
jgi:hypothetical protein